MSVEVATLESEARVNPGAFAARVREAAQSLVASGKVVPGLTVGADGNARSWWWPLPSVTDRALIASLCFDGSIASQRRVADALADAVDELVRDQISVVGVVVGERSRGRRSAEDAWLLALGSGDPSISGAFSLEALRSLEHKVSSWVASGAATIGATRLCLRVREPVSMGPDAVQPDAAPRSWSIELLVQDVLEPSLVVPTADIWNGVSPFASEIIEELAANLGRMARVAPELGAFLDEAMPTEMFMVGEELLDVVALRSGALSDIGIGVLLPTWWTQRRRLGLRVKASSRTSKGAADAVTSSGLGMDQLVSFRWEAALGDDSLTKAELKTLALAVEAKQALVQVRGEWVEVRADEFAAILDRHRAVQEIEVGALLRTGLGLDGIEVPKGTAISGVSATGWVGDLLDGALHASVARVANPPGFVGELRPYQELGAGWLAFLGRLGLGACLADDMGLGKTAQMIATMLADPASGPTLVVCPVSVLGNWQRELDRFAPDLKVFVHHGPDRFSAHRANFSTRMKRFDVVLTTYSLIARDIEHVDAVSWARLVLDEAQQIKNPGTAQTRAVQRVNAARRIAMTGTPVENRLSELWSIMHVLNPGLLGSRSAFRQRFAIPIEREGDQQATDLLRRVTAPFVLRRLKSDKSIIDDLPDKIETVDHCPLTREQATLYQAVVDDLLEQAEEAEGIGRRGLVLAGIMRLKQVCNHPAQFLRDGSVLAGRSGKLTRADELLDEVVAVGDRALCFTQFAEWGELLAPYWRARYGVDVGWLHGGVARKKRDVMVADFQECQGPGILLISLKAGGTGLNLTAASHVVHLDRWWNPAVEDQATDRAYRIGQRNTVQVHKLVSAGTIEERIDAMITAKRSLAERVVGTGEGWITELSTAELRDAISLSASADPSDDAGVMAEGSDRSTLGRVAKGN